jgi:hypothetical protein
VNIAESVKARLKNIAIAENKPFNYILIYYFIERLLYMCFFISRLLSCGSYRKRPGRGIPIFGDFSRRVRLGRGDILYPIKFHLA